MSEAASMSTGRRRCSWIGCTCTPNPRDPTWNESSLSMIRHLTPLFARNRAVTRPLGPAPTWHTETIYEPQNVAASDSTYDEDWQGSGHDEVPAPPAWGPLYLYCLEAGAQNAVARAGVAAGVSRIKRPRRTMLKQHASSYGRAACPTRGLTCITAR